MFRKSVVVAAIAAVLAVQCASSEASIRPMDISKPAFQRGQQVVANDVKFDARHPIHTKRHPSKALEVRGGVANTLTNAVAGSVALALIEKAVKKGLAMAKIEFPGQLAACIVLFSFLLLVETVSPALANGIFNALTPGSALLAKWLPVFFVPGLVLLPLSKPIGGAVEVCQGWRGSEDGRRNTRTLPFHACYPSRSSKCCSLLPRALSSPF